LVSCVATSSDSGKTWPIGSVKKTSGLAPVVHNYDAFVKDGSVYRLWYGGHYATSTDAINWVPSTVDPVANAPRTVLWNDTAQRYEGLTDTGVNVFAVVTRR
jgi:hypothetical protein